MDSSQLVLTRPEGAEDWSQYFNLRWRMLRAPWGQPEGSERDEMEESAYHLMYKDAAGAPAAIGRLHLNSPEEAQIRFMAVETAWQRAGLGSRILIALEAEAVKRGAKRVILNARRGVEPFYERHGYSLTGPAPTLFNAVRHVRMAKSLMS